MTDVEDPIVPLQEEAEVREPTWIPWDKSQEFPKNVLRGGVDINDEIIYVGRAKHNNCQLVAKVIETRGKSFIAFDGKEIEVPFVQVLLDDGRYCWEFGKDGAVPKRAVKVGKTNNDETVYVGRAFIGTSQTPGTILRFKGILSVPFGNDEHEFRAYEVLCFKPVKERNRSRTDRFFIEVGRVVCSILDCVFRTKLAENYPRN